MIDRQVDHSDFSGKADYLISSTALSLLAVVEAEAEAEVEEVEVAAVVLATGLVAATAGDLSLGAVVAAS